MILRTCLIILGIFVLTSCDTNSGGSFSGESPTIGDGIDGVNGSYTALVSVDNRLYYVDGEFLYTNDITDPANMVLMNKQNIGNNIETLFYRNNLIFIGSGPALYIYELDDEGIPFRISETRYDSFADDMVLILKALQLTELIYLFVIAKRA